MFEGCGNFSDVVLLLVVCFQLFALKKKKEKRKKKKKKGRKKANNKNERVKTWREENKGGEILKGEIAI